MRITHIDIGGDYKPGDMPPEGYVNWHEWAEVQHKAGLRQKWCGRCSLCRFPQEMSDVVDRSTATTRKHGGKEIVVESPVCKVCAEKAVSK